MSKKKHKATPLLTYAENLGIHVTGVYKNEIHKSKTKTLQVFVYDPEFSEMMEIEGETKKVIIEEI